MGNSAPPRLEHVNWRVFFALAVLLGAGCNEGVRRTSFWVTPAGSTIAAGQLSVVFPLGAFEKATEVKITLVDDDRAVERIAYRIEPRALVLRREARLSLALPANLALEPGSVAILRKVDAGYQALATEQDR